MTAPDAVEAAARESLIEVAFETIGRTVPLSPITRSDIGEWVDLLAPLIAQQTLLDAAEQITADNNDRGDWWDSAEKTYTTPTRWLTARAATLTPKEN